jgi:hypothetical protein
MYQPSCPPELEIAGHAQNLSPGVAFPVTTAAYIPPGAGVTAIGFGSETPDAVDEDEAQDLPTHVQITRLQRTQLLRPVVGVLVGGVDVAPSCFNCC